MANPIVYALLSVLLVSLIAIAAIIPLSLRKKISSKVLLLLVSLSAGTLFGGAILHFLPEALEEGFSLAVGFYIISGILSFFILEKIIHWHHKHREPTEAHRQVHGHAYHLAPLNLIGDGVHNFLDGLVIAGSYLVSIPLGIAATISIIFHEAPQEVADFGVLLYSGMSKRKAIFFNFVSACAALLGTIVGLLLGGDGFTHFIIPFAAGVFLYIAGSNLVPELHKHTKIRDSFAHLLMMVLGILIMLALTFMEIP